MKTLYTSEDIKAMECEEIADLSSSYESINYQMTEGEQDWLLFVANRYDIHDVLMHDGNGIVNIDFYECSIAMDADCYGMGKAVCLSEDSPLQKILFSTYQETDISEEN